MAEQTLTPKQVAVQLQVAEQTLARWRHDKVGPLWVKLGNGQGSRVRYTQKSIDEFLTPEPTQ